MNNENLKFPDGDELLRISQVAQLLNICDKGVRRLINHGKLKSRKIGGLRQIFYSDLRKYLDDAAA